MHKLLSRVTGTAGLLMLVFALMVLPAAAGDTALNNNSGDGNAVFYIEGEPSVVINGFDLTPLGLSLPVALDAISISVATPAPGSSIDLLVYQDANGGSPIDATLVHREQVAIAQAGLNRIELSQVAIITQPVVWVGFYLPVGFEFYADTSGSSVLTYWAWTPGGAFDVTLLSAAAVFGPGDGSEPVNIAMDGVARISAELRTAETEEIASGIPVGRQIVTDVGADTSPLRTYDNCGALLYDTADIEISAGSSFTIDCVVETGFNAPAQVAHPQNQRLFLQRIGALYKLSAAIPPELHAAGAVNTLPVPVTHCLRIPPEDLERAVIGEVRAQHTPAPGPEEWNILPSVRFNDIVCAEVTVANYLSYFVPETAESPENVNLVVGWTDVVPFPLYCGIPTSIRLPIVNTGQNWFDTQDHHITITLRDVHVPSSIITVERRHNIGPSQLGPGARQYFELGPLNVVTYINDLHRLEIVVDQENEVDETNESDNTWFGEYNLIYPPGHEECGPFPDTSNLVWDLSNSCILSLRISNDWEISDRRKLEDFERLVVNISKPSQVFDIDQFPRRDPSIPVDVEREDYREYLVTRGEFRRDLEVLFDTNWSRISAQVLAALELRAACLGQN